MSERSEQTATFKQWKQTVGKDSRWAILINADPDAMASAMALKRLLRFRTKNARIFSVNNVTRPDNLAMIRYLRIPMKRWTPESVDDFDCFGLVDSQPDHNTEFRELTYNLLIDHHPVTNLEGYLRDGAFCDVRPSFGATSSMMTQFLQGARVRPGPLLATALLYGIRTDTGVFERSGGEEDLRAYQWLSHHADNNLLRRISRSEYLRSWLPFFSRAFRNLRDCGAGGAYAPLNEIKSADLVVSVADFFTKVHGLKWIAVSGIVDKKVIVVFRGDGSRDMGRFADGCFYDVGTAGGHRNLARAEFPLSAIPAGVKPQDFIYDRLMKRKIRPESKRHINKPTPLPAATFDVARDAK